VTNYTGGRWPLLVLQDFDNRGNLFMVVWGQAVSLLYIVVDNILIMSLVVAVITHAYNPERIKAHAIVMQAESTFHYDFHGKARRQSALRCKVSERFFPEAMAAIMPCQVDRPQNYCAPVVVTNNSISSSGCNDSTQTYS
jgi:hypothetical protein